MHGTTILNGRGDLTIAWDEPDDERVLAMIREKMAAGWHFFLVEPRMGGMAAPARVPLRAAEDAARARVVSMSIADKDQAIAGLLESGAAVPVPASDKPMRRRRTARTAEEAAAGETVAVRPARGG